MGTHCSRSFIQGESSSELVDVCSRQGTSMRLIDMVRGQGGHVLERDDGAHLYIACVFGIHLQFAKTILIIKLYNHSSCEAKNWHSLIPGRNVYTIKFNVYLLK